MLNFWPWKRRGQAVIFECHNCGASLTPLEVEDEHCRYCGPTRVVRYELV